MIQKVSAPGKILLFGEWGVLNGHPGVAMAVAPRLSLSWKPSSDLRNDGVILIRGENQSALWDWKVPISQQILIPAFLSKPVEMINILSSLRPEIHKLFIQGGELRIDRNWPLEWGLGSSSAIVACLIELFLPKIERIEKWLLGLEILRAVQNGKASGLDLAAQLRGGVVKLSLNQPRPIIDLVMPKQIYFLHASEKADTTDLIKNKALSETQMNYLGKSCEEFILHRDWLKTMHEHAEILSETAVWPESLTNVRKNWLNNAWIKEMKSCGAGGGDTWMLWCDSQNIENIQIECQKRNWILKQYSAEVRGVDHEQA